MNRILCAAAALAVVFFAAGCATVPYTADWKENYPLAGFDERIPTGKPAAEMRAAAEAWLAAHTDAGGKRVGGAVLNARTQFTSHGDGWTASSILLADLVMEFGDGEVRIRSQNERVRPYRLNGKAATLGEMRHDDGFTGETAEQIRRDAAAAYSSLCRRLADGMREAAAK